METLQVIAVGDLDQAGIAVIISIVVCAVLLRFAPAGLACIGFTMSGLGQVDVVGGQRYAAVSGLIGCFGVAVALLHFVRSRSASADKYRLPVPAIVLLALIAVMWFKIGAECFGGGVDDFRRESLRAALTRVLIPFLIVGFRIFTVGPSRAGSEFAVGLVALATAYYLPLFPRIVFGGRIPLALFGEMRLTAYGQDTINSARMMFFGALGATIVFSGATSRKGQMIALFFGVMFFSGLVLNGTRQYLVGTLVTVAMVGLSKLRVPGARAAAIAVVVGVLAFLGWFVRAQNASSRFGSDDISSEMGEGRGRIWSEAFAVGVSKPLTGLGYRRFGEEHPYMAPGSEDVVLVKDNAHGCVQEIVSDHGVVLGLLVGMSAAWVMVGMVRRVWNENFDPATVITAGIGIGLTIPENFSGGMSNAWSYYLLPLLAVRMVRKADKVMPRTETLEVARLSKRAPIADRTSEA